MAAARTFRKLGPDEVRAAVGGHPVPLVQAKLLDRLDIHCRAFIERAPFVAVATAGAGGPAGAADLDISPRGDPAGFVRVLDDRTLAIPERPGNKLIDTLSNVLATGRIGLLFLVPGVGETLRVNGSAYITDDAELLASMEVRGKRPLVAVVVEVEEAFLHCAKAFIRSQLWDPAAQIDRRELPTLGKMIHDQVTPDLPVAELDALVEADERDNLY